MARGKAEAYWPPMMKEFKLRGAWIFHHPDRMPGRDEGGGPDYTVSLGVIQVEIKNTEYDGTLAGEPTKLQRKYLDMYGGFVMVVLWDPGYPDLPEGGDAYLVPWKEYVEWWDNIPKGISVRRHPGQRSTTRPNLWAAKYQLVWNKGTWIIPAGHEWWKVVAFKAHEVYEFFYTSINELKPTTQLKLGV